MKAKRHLALAAAILLLLGGCGARSTAGDRATAASSQNKQAYEADGGLAPTENSGMMEDTAQSAAGAGTAGNIDALSARKQIYHGALQLETTQYDEALDRLGALVQSSGGYVEERSVYTGWEEHARRCEMTVRIPSEQFEAFLSGSADIATLITSSTWTEDITDQYYDVEAHLNALKTKEARLLALLQNSADLEALLQVESQLADTRYEIEALEGALRRYDSQIAYSTVTLTVQEVSAAQAGRQTPVTLSQRIGDRFSRSLESLKNAGGDALVFLIGSLPVIVPVVAVLALVYALWLRPKLRRRRAKKEAPPQETDPKE